MKTLRTSAVLAVAVAIVLGGTGKSSRSGSSSVKGDAASVTKSISIKDDSFSTSSISITKKDSITWSWKKTKHNHGVTVDSGPADFHSKTQKGTHTYTHTFGTTGTYRLVCPVHSFMTTTVRVKKKS